MRVDERLLESAVPESIIVQGTFPQNPRFSIDTRTLQPGDIFLAIEGKSVDGHQFIEQALTKKAGGIILNVRKKNILTSFPESLRDDVLIVLVPDTVEALTQCAAAWRSYLTCPIIAITGSFGKTTTKALLRSILQEANKRYFVSYGNQNTLIGVSLNILHMREEHEGGIFEVGINKRGEMDRLAALLRPTTAVITSVGHTHMEGLGSLADVATEKRAIFNYFKEDSIGIINGDQPLLSNVAYVHPVIKFGTKTTNQVQARKVAIGSEKTTLTLKLYNKKHTVVVPYNHVGGVMNSLAATAVAHHMGIAPEIIIRALEKPVVVEGRFERRKLINTRGFLINDCYNANPENMREALLALERIETSGKKIAVLGDMLELGADSAFWHRQVGRFLRKVPSLDHVILIGPAMESARKTVPVGITVDHVQTSHEALKILGMLLASEAVVLVKASRAMRLDALVEAVSVTPTPAQSQTIKPAQQVV